MTRQVDQSFELEDGNGNKAHCRVRVYTPYPGEKAPTGQPREPVVLLAWKPDNADFHTGPWLETILTGLRDGLAALQAETNFLLIEWYQPTRYQVGNILMNFDEELGLVLFKGALPTCNSPSANLRAGKRKARASENAPSVRHRRSVYWLPLCRGAVEDIVGESLDSPAPDALYSVTERQVTA